MRTFTYLAVASVAAICLAASFSTSALAATPAPAEARVFDAVAKREAIEAAAKLLIDDYVYPEVGARAAAMLRKNLDDGRYDALEPEAFAVRMTQDLQALTHDKHLNVSTDGFFGPPESRKLPRSLFGFAEASRLKGNVGYVVVNGFVPGISWLGANPAMAAVASTDALIIDLRNNNGGDPGGVTYLASFFFDGKTPVHLNDLLWRKPGTAEYDRTSFRTGPTPVSYLDKPVYLLTSDRTFSGGEELAYDLQALKRAKVVGEVTGGGANPGRGMPIGPFLYLFVPAGRGENPVTGTSWEGVGVQPDIPASEDDSFGVAYAEALKAIGGKAPASAVTAEAVTEAQLLPPPRTTPAPGAEAALRRWIAGLAEGKPPMDILGGLMRWVVDAQGEALGADMKRLGALQSVAFIKVDDIGLDVYEATFAHGSMVFSIAMEPDGKLGACWQQPK